MLDNMLALADCVLLLALSHSYRHVRALVLCAGQIALCCACGRCSTTTWCVTLGAECALVIWAQGAGAEINVYDPGTVRTKKKANKDKQKIGEKNGKIGGRIEKKRKMIQQKSKQNRTRVENKKGNRKKRGKKTIKEKKTGSRLWARREKARREITEGKKAFFRWELWEARETPREASQKRVSPNVRKFSLSYSS